MFIGSPKNEKINECKNKGFKTSFLNLTLYSLINLLLYTIVYSNIFERIMKDYLHC